MCIFHRWGLWSVLLQRSPDGYTESYQERYCQKCGKYKRRVESVVWSGKYDHH